MNKIKILIVSSLLLGLALPVEAVTCNRLAKRYSIYLNTVSGPVAVSLRIFSKVTNIEYSAQVIDNIGDVYNVTVFKNCNRFSAILPVSVIDNVGFDGDIGDYYEFDYQCNGAVRKNGVIAGGCDISGTYAGILITDSGGFNAYPTDKRRFRKLERNVLQLSDLLKTNK